MSGSTPARTVVAVTTGFDEYQNPLLDGMRKGFAGSGIRLIAHGDDSVAPDIPPSLHSLLYRPSTCGLITTSTNSGALDLALASWSVAHQLSTVGIGQEHAHGPVVRADNRPGMTALLRLLLDECAVRTPVLIQGHANHPDHVLRERVFREELAKRNIVISPELIIPGSHDLQDTRDELRALLARRRDLDAVVCMDDHLAQAAIEVLCAAGLRVPQDVVVTGFDNYPSAAINWPSVTTVDQNLERQGITAAEIMLAELAGHSGPAQVLTACELIPRGSCATGRARELCREQSVEQVSRVAREHLTCRAQLLRTGSGLMKCQTLTDVAAALPEGLAVLGIVRAFIVIYGTDPKHHGYGSDQVPQGPDPAGCQLANLVFDYRRGRTHPLPGSNFPARDILPDHLQVELRRGFLGMRPLAGRGGPVGYLLFEQRVGFLPMIENLVMDLSRVIEVILNTAALNVRSSVLERVVVQRTQELAAEVHARRRIEQDLRVANAELERSAVLDGLTRVANRAALDLHLAEHWSRHAERGARLAVVMVDVDFFKTYNDHYGHLRGDAALRSIADCLRQAACYPDDLVCRFGGEEFTVVLPNSGERSALTVATRFSRLLSAAALPHAASPVAPVVTASVGIAVTIPEPGSDPYELILAADRALYRAKQAGRNHIEF
jgi:diguanylate cyclase (GGDEF)-like protein